MLDEWRAARGDHKIVAFAIANCLKIPDLVSIPRRDFTALMLDLRPTGEHYFLTASANADAPDRNNTASGNLQVTAYQESMLLLSDAVARARVAAAAGAAWNYPGVTQYGWYTVAVSALATLFITLKSAMSSTTREGDTSWFRDPAWWRNFSFGAFGILAILFSTLGTVLTSVKQFYDPTRAYLRNEVALSNLRALHQQVALAFIATAKRCRGWRWLPGQAVAGLDRAAHQYAEEPRQSRGAIAGHRRRPSPRHPRISPTRNRWASRWQRQMTGKSPV